MSDEAPSDYGSAAGLDESNGIANEAKRSDAIPLVALALAGSALTYWKPLAGFIAFGLTLALAVQRRASYWGLLLLGIAVLVTFGASLGGLVTSQFTTGHG